MKILDAPSSIEHDDNYYILPARDLDKKVQSFPTGYYQSEKSTVWDSKNFSDVIHTVPSNTCFNLSDIPSAQDPAQLHFYMCKDECNFDFGDCCVSMDDLHKIDTYYLSCYDNINPIDANLEAYCKR